MNGFTNRETLIWLNSIYISNATTKVLLEYFDNIKNIWDVSNSEISKIKGIKEKVKDKILINRNPDQLKAILEKIDELGINTVTILDENYPNRLRYIHNSPTVLYCNGTLVEEDEVSISIVGSRKSTSYGKWASEKFSKELASLGVTVVSGMAKGIDTCAHRGALNGNGRTVAVLGSGVDVVYPRNNKKLYEEIIKQGVVISEFPIGTQPFATNFPQRNRIISGISLGIIVIEATEKSGSLITATHALEQGKEVFALPGNINSIFSRGTNSLIKDGAKIVMDIEDILEEIYELKERLRFLKNEEIDYSDLSPIEIKIVDTLKERPIHCDNIVYLTGLDISTVISTLTILELKGIAKELPGRVYTLS